jgi:hypothetical protein
VSELEVDVIVPDTPAELFALIGDPVEEPASPFTLIMLVGEAEVARAPIGIYRRPLKVGEIVRSAWPAIFRGPLRASGWALLDTAGDRVAGRAQRLPTLRRGDEMEASLRLVGKPPEPARRRRWWRR